MSKVEKLGQEVMYYSKYFNSNYLEFFGYETCDKLICTSGEVRKPWTLYGYFLSHLKLVQKSKHR